MAFTKLTEDVNYIQALSDLPNEEEGLTAQELKVEFDKAGNTLKTAFNGLVDELESNIGGASIGVTEIYDGDTSPNNVQDKLKMIYEAVQESVIGQIPDGSITKAKLEPIFSNVIAEKNGTLQTDLNAEKLNGVKLFDLYANSKYHIPSYTKTIEPTFEENSIPTLASNVTPNYTITAESTILAYRHGELAYYLFDSNYNNRYTESGTTLDALMAFDDDGYIKIASTNKYIKPTKFKIYAHTSETSGTRYAILQASNDERTWEELGRVALYHNVSAFREETLNISTQKYYKYFRIMSSSSTPMEVNKINISGDTLSTLDINRLDLNIGCEEYYEGMKLSLKIPDTLDSNFTTKLQLDGLGYKDIVVNKGNVELTYSNDKFMADKISGSYLGNGTTHSILTGFKPRIIIIIYSRSGYAGNGAFIVNGNGVTLGGSSVNVTLNDNGFVLNSSTMNETDKTYSYMAIR